MISFACSEMYVQMSTIQAIGLTDITPCSVILIPCFNITSITNNLIKICHHKQKCKDKYLLLCLVCINQLPGPGHTKDHHKSGTNCLPALACMRQGRSLTVQPDCLKSRVVCGTVYGDMHLKDLLGSFVRVGYCIPVPDFYLVLHDLRC